MGWLAVQSSFAVTAATRRELYGLGAHPQHQAQATQANQALYIEVEAVAVRSLLIVDNLPARAEFPPQTATENALFSASALVRGVLSTSGDSWKSGTCARGYFLETVLDGFNVVFRGSSCDY
ncbi:hypothetical protein BJX61DRAFT_92875 [Aspergillus egyptiacus]|nr:hypothetical protein BJX61DRAFT_92875 [Aspergillus egyptiacus]